MRKRIFLPLAAALVLAACGETRMSTAPTAEPYTPLGESARLRIVALEPEITCDGETHDVQIWLDDLPRAPVKRDDEISTAPPVDGVSAFQFRLTFDPAVVWIDDVEDVKLGPDLDSYGADPATLLQFVAATPFIDNNEGYAFMGGLNLGIAGDIRVVPEGNKPTPLPQPGGIDPFTAKESILLFTVGLKAVGAGGSSLSLTVPQLLSGLAHRYEPVDVVESSVRVGGDCADYATATPRVTPTATLVAPATVEPPETVPVTPMPATGIRDDCPGGWAVADEERFSFCYPPSALVAFRTQFAERVNYNLTFPSERSSDGFLLVIAHNEGRSYDRSRGCESAGAISNPTKVSQIEVSWGGGSEVGCALEGMVEGRIVHLLSLDIPFGDSFLGVFSSYSGPDRLGADELTRAVIATLVMP